MVDQHTFLRVRSLGVGGRSGTHADRIESLLQDDGEGLAAGQQEWIQDNTGRVTDQSQDEESAGNTTEESSSSSNTVAQEDALPSSTSTTSNPHNPVVLFSPDIPFYPIEYSCEHLVQRQQQPEDGQAEVPPQQQSDHHSNDTTQRDMDDPEILQQIPVEVLIEFLLPSIIDEEATDIDDVIKNVEALEWSLLNLVVDTTGLSRYCDIDRQFSSEDVRSTVAPLQEYSDYMGDDGLQRRLPESNSLPYPTSIYTVASDHEYTKWRASCENMEYDQASSKCFTLQTELIVKYKGSPEAENIAREYVQDIIHKRITEDPKQLFAMNVMGLHWVKPGSDGDDFSFDSNTIAPIDTSILDDVLTQAPTSKNSLSFTSPQVIIPFCTGLFVLLVWIVFHLCARKNTRQRSAMVSAKTINIAPSSKADPDDIETGSVATERTITPNNSDRDFSSDFGTPDQKEISRKGSNGVAGIKSLSTPVRRSVPVSVDSPDRKPLPVSKE
ncbi:MAG: hypothetical protein SGARI_001126 [Bacillariaceae sp.]